MIDLQSSSADELQTLISNAKKALESIKFNKRKEVITQIKELAASIDMVADLSEIDKKSVRKTTTKVAIKYRNPDNAENTWTGRGVMPKWLRALLEAGRDRSEFEV